MRGHAAGFDRGEIVGDHHRHVVVGVEPREPEPHDADGDLFFEGRLGEMIKTGGANVTPLEVERVLEGYAEVKVAHVVGIPDPDRGQLVAAAVVLEPGSGADATEIRARVKAELSAYKVPRYLLALSDEELPFTDTGKIDKRRLSTLLAESAAAEEKSQ